MARRPRLEVEGGLYHLITRGVDRRDIFHSPEDYRKFLSLLAEQKEKLPFFLYAFCLMTNHIHLLIERRTHDIGRIMHRVLTGYTQYYNRRYRRSGHLLQGRHKSILCQSDPYLAELVRYIHLNPVRAKMVERVEVYPYTSHLAYMGIDGAGPIDVDPVLRRFGNRKAVARERYAKHIAAGVTFGHLNDFYETKAGILGSEEFVDSMIHRMGEFVPTGTPEISDRKMMDADELMLAVQTVCQVSREDICSKAKGRPLVNAREILIVAGRRAGMTTTALSHLTGLSIATISRRHDAAIRDARQDGMLEQLIARVMEKMSAGQESSRK